MAGDFNKPVVTDGYSSVLTYIRDLFADIAKGMDGTGTTNTPTGAIRWNSTNKYWEKYNGSWAALESKYMINVDQLDGYHANATATAGQIPVRDGSGKVDNVSFTGVSGTLGTGNGGTGLTSFTLGDITYCSATNTLSKLAGNTTTTKQYLTQTGTGSASAAPQWSVLADADVPGTLTNKTLSTGCSWSGNTIAVGSGGTGVTSYTTGDLLYASGAAALSKLAAVAAGSVLASNGAGAAPVWTNAPTISGIVTHTAASSNGKYAVHLSNASPYISMWDTDNSRKWLMGSDGDSFRAYRATTQSETATDWVEKFKVDANGTLTMPNSVVTSAGVVQSNYNSQTGYSTAGLQSQSTSGNAGLGLHCSGASAAYIEHVRGGDGINVKSSTGAFANIGCAILSLNGTANYINMIDSGWGTRYIHHNDGLIGFLTSGAGWASYTDNSGNFTAVGNVTAYSDKRLKSELQVIQNALAKVKQLTGYTFAREGFERRQAGLIADDVEVVLPEVVDVGVDGYKTLAYGNTIALLVNAINELSEQVEELKRRM